MKRAVEKISELSPELKIYYTKLVEQIMSNLKESRYHCNSAMGYTSFKIPVSYNNEQIFVTFEPRPTKNYIYAEIFIEFDKLLDPNKICNPYQKPGENREWSTFHLSTDIDLNYCHYLIEQAYNNIKSKSRVSKNNRQI